jgi:hypothetical protein
VEDQQQVRIALCAVSGPFSGIPFSLHELFSIFENYEMIGALDGASIMEKQCTPPAWKRVHGGFREQFCHSCQECWPLDQEFFLFSRNSVSYECRACIEERKALRQ